MRNTALHGTAWLALAAGLAGPLLAQEPIAPETLTVETTIAPGSNLFIMDQSWSGQSRINVLAADDFAMKGNIGIGLNGQMVLSADGATLYTASVYPKRITYGPQEVVVHEMDVATLSRKREFLISEKMAQVETQPGILRLAGGGKFLLVQNATPATSVSVIDLEKGEQIAEVPTPGCWTIEPLGDDLRFLTLCGDGTMKTYGFDASGGFSEAVSSEPLFDIDADALFANAARMGDDLLFVSFNGTIYRISVTDGKAALADSFSITEGTEGWAPGGSEVIAYHAPSNVAFVLMHSGAEDGSHKNGAEEIWAVDMASKTRLYRSVAGGENGLTVSKSTPAVLFAASADESLVNRYEVDPDAKSAAKAAGKAESMGNFVSLALTDE